MNYIVKEFNSREAKEIFKKNPQNLSLNEMYILAGSHEKGSPEFIDIFETAVRLFPDNETANLNAATAALSRRDTVTAERHLAKVKTETAEYCNTAGVLMLLKENYTEAEYYLQKASATGLKEATINLSELQKKQDNIQQMKKQKDYNP